MYPFEYKVNIWDDFEGKEEIVCGITFGEDFVHAMEHIEEYYGDTLILVELYPLEEGTVYELDMIKESFLFNKK